MRSNLDAWILVDGEKKRLGAMIFYETQFGARRNWFENSSKNGGVRGGSSS